jgi:hypothetical protein
LSPTADELEPVLTNSTGAGVDTKRILKSGMSQVALRYSQLCITAPILSEKDSKAARVLHDSSVSVDSWRRLLRSETLRKMGKLLSIK